MEIIIKIVEFLVTLILIPCMSKLINLVTDTFIGDNKLSIKKVVLLLLFFIILIAMITAFIFSEELLYVLIIFPILVLFTVYVFNFRKINIFFKNYFSFLRLLVIKFFMSTKKHKYIFIFSVLFVLIIVFLKFLCNLTVVPIDSGKKYTIVSKNVIQVIPKNLTEIPSGFYKDNNLLKSITVPEHIKAIRQGAFENCRSLKKIVIGSNVRIIEDDAFKNCTELEIIEFKNKEKISLGNNVFYDCKKLKFISLPDTVKEAGIGVFNGCENLESVVLPNNRNFDSLEASFFADCKKLSSVMYFDKENNKIIEGLPDNIKNIGTGAFYECINLKQLNFNNVKIIQTTAFLKSGIKSVELKSVENIFPSTFSNCENLEKVIAPKLKHIYTAAFSDCPKLINVEIGNDVKKIDPFAFFNCGFSEFNIPDSLEEVGDCAFLKCMHLTNFKINNNENFIIDNGVLLNKGKNELICMPSTVEKYIIGKDINKIRKGAIGYLKENCVIDIDSENEFYKKSDLFIYKDDKIICILPNENDSLVLFDKNITEIGPFAGIGCNLKHIDLLFTGITEISDYAFYDCKELKSVNLPLQLQEIGSYAFSHCNKITRIEIPAKIKTINKNTFASCSGLKEIQLSSNIEKIDEKAFMSTNIYSVALPDSVTFLGTEAFGECKNLKYVKLPEKLGFIHDSVFNNAEKLQIIEVPETLDVSNLKEYYKKDNKKVKIKKYKIKNKSNSE